MASTQLPLTPDVSQEHRAVVARFLELTAPLGNEVMDAVIAWGEAVRSSALDEAVQACESAPHLSGAAAVRRLIEQKI